MALHSITLRRDGFRTSVPGPTAAQIGCVADTTIEPSAFDAYGDGCSLTAPVAKPAIGGAPSSSQTAPYLFHSSSNSTCTVRMSELRKHVPASAGSDAALDIHRADRPRPHAPTGNMSVIPEGKTDDRSVHILLLPFRRQAD